MSKKFNSIKKGLTKAIEDADGGTLGTRINHPHLSLPLFSQPEQVEIYTPKDALIPARLGGGVLKESVTRELPSKKVISYALAYVNPAIYAGDNGRVLGYDNKHGFSHRHFMGQVTAEAFLGYAALYERFEREWQEIAIKFVNGE